MEKARETTAQKGKFPNLRLTDLFAPGELSHLQDLFSDATGIASFITRPDGMPVTPLSEICMLCAEHNRNTGKEAVTCFQGCAGAESQEDNSTVVLPCVCPGLWKAKVKIIVGGIHLANWFIGPVKEAGADETCIKPGAANIRDDSEPFACALQQVPAMSLAQFNIVSKLLVAFAGELSGRAYDNLQLRQQVASQEMATTQGFTDLTENQAGMEKIKKSEERFHSIYEHMTEGVALHEIIFDSDGIPADYIILETNPAFDAQLGISGKSVIGKRSREAYGVEDPPFLEIYVKVALTGNPTVFETYFPPLKKYFSISAYCPGKGSFATIFEDITDRKQAENNLTSSEEKFRNLVRDMQVGVLLQGPQAEIQLSNPMALELLGLTEDQLLGKTSFDPDWNVIHPDGSPFPGATHPVPRAIETREPVRNVIMGVFRPVVGDRIWLLVDAQPEFGSDGLLQHVICTFSDISKRIKAEEDLRETNAYLENLINYANAPIIVWDPNFRITRFNHAFESLSGHREEDILGQSLEILFPPALTAQSMALIHQTMTGEHWESVEIDIMHRDGSVKTVLWNSATLFSPDGRTVIATIAQGQDISGRIQAEKLISLKNQELIVLNAEKDKFFSIIAHDLRSPFNSFLGFTRMMAEELPSLRLEEIQKIATTMMKSATSLYELLENLLEWSRLQRNLIHTNPEPGLLMPRISWSLQSVLESAQKKEIGIRYEIPEDLSVFADENMFGSVIRNLVSNAVKYTPRGGVITIAAKPVDGNYAEISVTDTGIGMSWEITSHLFDINHDTNRKGTENEPSTGLGLIICKDFIEKHGGTFSVESEEGKGSSFRFTISMHA